MKIYADENIEQAIIEGLRRRGVRIVSAREIGYTGKSDDFHLRRAAELHAVILTHDNDFLEIAERFDHNGIIFAHSKNVSIGRCVRGVELIASLLTERDMKNHIEFL